MLASHNTLTYMRARQWWARLCPWVWRCQTLTVAGQTASGVSMLDIRVVRHRGRWYGAHGLVRLGEGFATIGGLLTSAGILKTKPMRLILERGDEADEAAFTDAVRYLLTRHDITLAAIKRGWRVIHSDPRDALCRDHYYKPFDSALPLWRNILNLVSHPSTIARCARRCVPHHPEWAADGLYHFIDRI